MEYPKSNIEFIDIELEGEMEIVKKLVSQIHFLRKNNNIKVRQPLSKITLFSEKNLSFLKEFKDIILTETNIKCLEIVNDCSNLFTYIVKPNFKLLGQKYKNSINEIVTEINNFNENQINELRKNKNILLHCNVKLDINECIFKLKPKENICIGECEDIILAIDNNITKELKEECIARDFINLIQNYRKSKSFKIDDKMEIQLFTNDNSILEAINNNLNLVNNALLCTKLTKTEYNEKLEKQILNNSDIYIQIRQIN